MLNPDVIAYLQEHLPKQAIDLQECLQLLIATLDDTMDNIVDKASTVAKGRSRDVAAGEKHYKNLHHLEPLTLQLREVMERLEPGNSTSPASEDDDEEGGREPRNYGDYVVDQNIAHSLYEDYTHKRPAAFELRGVKVDVKDWKELFLSTCEHLIAINPELFRTFADNPDMQGRKVQYFSRTIDDTMRSPRHLEAVGMYVATVFSANSIRNIIVNMLRKYKIPLSEFSVYLRADYSTMPR